MSEAYGDHPVEDRPPLPGADDLPCDDGVPMETGHHVDQMLLLISSLEWAWRDRDDFYASGNMFFYFSEAQIKKNDFLGPDFFVVLNTTRHHRKSWVVWEENGQVPDVVVELLSASTEHNDRGKKKDIYEGLGVRAYYLFDPVSLELEGFELVDGTYQSIAPDEAGRLSCPPLHLRLGVHPIPPSGDEHPRLRLFDDAGELVPTGLETAKAAERRADDEKRRADDEKQRADALAARVAELEEKLGSS